MRKRFLFSCLVVLLAWLSSPAQDSRQISIATKNVELRLSVGADGRLYQQYFGGKINLPPAPGSAVTGVAGVMTTSAATRHEAYIAAGMEDLFEPAIRIIQPDGNPSLVLHYSADSVGHPDKDQTSTTIVLKDPVYPIEVRLHFLTYYEEDVITTWTEIINAGKKPVFLTDFASAMLHFDANRYWLTQFHGNWAKEVRMVEEPLTSGIKIIDTKLGTRADMYQSPLFFLTENEPGSETQGHVLAGTLAWTGNFQFKFEVDEKNSLRLIAGINPFASAHPLAAGQTFTTPAFIYTYSVEGKGLASRNLHRWARSYGILDGKQPRLTLLNNWETTFFDFNEKKLTGLLDDAKDLGVDLFLLDDGWFGNDYPRNDDHAGLGDWEPMKAKLPNGLAPLVDQANARGIKFGIWVEPEMVNPQSDLYKRHPDWILKLPNRPESYYRNQLVLDLINPAVQDFVFGIIDRLFTANPGLAYIKWDCNRLMTNAWSPYLKTDQSTLYIDYVKSLYRVLDRIRAKYPHVPMMLCSGGGGRTDYGALKYFTEFWASDDTDPVERVFIQWGYSYFFPSFAVCNHVTSWGKQSIKFRTDVAMMGKLGFDINIHQLSADELAFCRSAVGEYKRLSPVIWGGDLYRLVSPYTEDRAVLLYVDSLKTQAVLFAYNLHTRYDQAFMNVCLRGLDPDRIYTVREINLMPGAKSRFESDGKTFTGDFLMKVGLQVSSNQPLTSAVFELTSYPGKGD